MRAWTSLRVARGRDFITTRPNAPYIAVLKAHELLLVRGHPWYPLRFRRGRETRGLLQVK